METCNKTKNKHVTFYLWVKTFAIFLLWAGISGPVFAHEIVAAIVANDFKHALELIDEKPEEINKTKKQ